MRNKIAHEYFGVDIKIVWDTARKYLPKLGKQLTKIKNLENDNLPMIAKKLSN